MMDKTMKINGETVKIDKWVPVVTKTEVKWALAQATRNFGFREQDVYNSPASIELNSHVYPGDRYVTADLYDTEGNGFQFIVTHQTDQKRGYKPGDITG